MRKIFPIFLLLAIGACSSQTVRDDGTGAKRVIPSVNHTDGPSKGTRDAAETECVLRGGFLVPTNPKKDVFDCKLPNGKQVNVLSLI